MDRDNDAWIAALGAEGPERETAVSELREVLLRNLRQGLANRTLDEAFLEDVVQESLVRVLDRLDQFAGRSRFVTWATSISINIALGELRRSRWRDVSLDDVLADADFVPQRAVDPELSPAAQAERRAIFDSMRLVIDSQLTEKQRNALLAELSGMPVDEIARQLGSNRNAVCKLMHDARRKLKRGLESVGYTAEDVLAAVKA